MRKLLVATGDMHGNSTTGLCVGPVNLDDGGTYHLSAFQNELQAFYLQDLKYIKDLASNGPLRPSAPILGILGGDLGEGDAKGRSEQVISRNPKTILDIAIANVEPLAEICDKMYFLRGTAAHVGKSSHIDEQIAANFDNTVWDTETAASFWELRLNIDGYRVYSAHHPPSMTNPVTVAQKLRNKYISYNEPPPDIGIFFHVHNVRDSGETMKPRVISAPCWQLPTEYIYRIPIMEAPQIGMLIFELENGQLKRLHVRRHEFKMRREIRA